MLFRKAAGMTVFIVFYFIFQYVVLSSSVEPDKISIAETFQVQGLLLLYSFSIRIHHSNILHTSISVHE